MKVQHSQNYRPVFGAIKIADTKNCIKGLETPISIYILSQKDIPFLNHLKNTTKMDNLMSKVPQNMVDIWQEIFNISITQAKNSRQESLIGLFKNRPCSIINYTKDKFKYKIDTICTWPAEKDKKVPLAGKTMFQILFKDFLKEKAGYMDIDAITNGPFNAVAKYMSLGFKQRGGENGIVAMRATNDAIAHSSQKLDEFIKIFPDKNHVEIDLTTIIV